MIQEIITILNWFIVLHGFMLFPLMYIAYKRFFRGNFREILFWAFLTYTVAYFSYAIVSMNSLFLRLEWMSWIDTLLFLIAILLALKTVERIYKFSEEYGFEKSGLK